MKTKLQLLLLPVMFIALLAVALYFYASAALHDASPSPSPIVEQGASIN